MLLKNECKLYIGSWGCHREERTQRGSVLSTAGRNCCNYTVHGGSLWGARKEEMTSQRVAENKIEGASCGFSVLIKELDKNRILWRRIARRSWHDSSGLIWWDCFKKKRPCLCLCACLRSASLVLFRADNSGEKTHSDKDRWGSYFRIEWTIFRKSCFPPRWRGLLIPAALTPNIWVMWLPDCLTCDCFHPRPAWMYRATTTHVTPPDSSASTLSG